MTIRRICTQLRKAPLLPWVIVGTALLGALWGTLAWDLARQTARAHRDVRRQVETVADLGSQALRFTMRTADLILVDLREHWLRDAREFDTIVQRRKVDALLGAPFDTAVLDRDGRLLYASANPQAVGMNLAESSYFRRLRERGSDDVVDVAPAETGLIRERTVIRFSRPVMDSRGGVAGFIVLAVSPDIVSDLLATIDLGAATAVTVMHAGGGIVARVVRAGDAAPSGTRQDARTADGPSDAPRVLQTPAQMGAPPTFLATSPVDGIERVFSWRNIAPYPLVVIVGRATTVIDADLAPLRTRYGFVGAAASLFTMILVYWTLARRRDREMAARRREAQLAALARSENALRSSEKRLRELAAHQMLVKEEERKRIAQEIHDDLGQRLTVLRMDIARLPRAVGADPVRMLPPQVAMLKFTIDEIVGSVRDIAGKLRPPALDLGLGPAAEALVHEFEASLAIPCDFVDRLPARMALDEVRATAAFRILQESLTNVARHAEARHVRVSLATERGFLTITVRDDGRGIGRADRRLRSSFGITGMRERAAALGGTVSVSTSPGGGTTVSAQIPLGDAPTAVASPAAAEATNA